MPYYNWDPKRAHNVDNHSYPSWQENASESQSSNIEVDKGTAAEAHTCCHIWRCLVVFGSVPKLRYFCVYFTELFLAL